MQDTMGAMRSLTWQDSAFFAPPEEVGPELLATGSIFEGHLLTPLDPKLTPVLIDAPETWLFPILLVCFLILAFAVGKGGFPLAQVLRAAYDRAAMGAVLRTVALEGGMAGRMLFPMATVVIAVFFVGAMPSFSAFFDKGHGHVTTLGVVALLSGLFFAGAVADWLLGRLFMLSSTVRLRGQERTVLLISCGVTLLPLTVAMMYGPAALSVFASSFGLVVTAFFLLRDTQRSLSALWAEPGVSPWHIFYYFCSLKLLPLSVALRAFLFL